MKVYLPAILGHVPDQMVRAIATFLEFCYLVRHERLDDDDINKLNELLAKFHTEREIFRDEEIWPDGFHLPHQHSLVHYAHYISEYGAPNGLCSSITESKHIKAVKEPWRRSNKFNMLSQMLVTNQRIDKMSTLRVEFKTCGMLSGQPLHIDPLPEKPNLRRDDNDEEGDLDGKGITAEVELPRTCSTWS